MPISELTLKFPYRYLMQDDPKQSAKATDLIESLTLDTPGFVSIISIVQLGWVLSTS